MLICGKAVDFDKLFSYDTFKVVKVRDRRLGILHRIFQCAILVYLIFVIIKDSGYLKKELPVPGAIRITLQAPSNISVPSYCSGGSLGCTFWGANEIQYPNDGSGFAFFTTRAYAARYLPSANCNFLNVSDPNSECFFNQKKANITEILPKSYIGGIEDYTMMIEHSIRGQVTSIAIRNGLLDGQLFSSDRKTVIKTFTNASRTAENPEADGDIITIREMLQAANANLDSLSTAPGASDGETYRSSGIVIVIVIEYTNVAFKKNEIRYKYLPQVIDGNEYKSIENLYNPDGSFTIVERHGIRFIFQQHGSIGEFDFITLLTNIVASLALFKVATTIVELLMLNFLPEKEHYSRAVIEHTRDFGDLREGVDTDDKNIGGP
ncbi:hypothetical protein Glove_99g184 [Diversispora epigaea]|uniref:Uncharacterized protein n=1 Tax=Diversispora epigaea TaxID=1348612 RepID=A0A397JEH6_9GLOM|nr:hypothetical protein Glove_99g184 [Diversispora epigaea]